MLCIRARRRRLDRGANLTAVTARLVVGSLLAAALAACTTHPLQQDVTGIPTKAVVDRIRCEARVAVLDKAVAVLRGHARRPTTPPALRPRIEQLADRLESQRGREIEIEPQDLPTEAAQSFYRRYINTVIVYDFLLQGTETNRVSLSADPVRLVTNGIAGLTVGGSGEFTRDNQRHFAVSDTFSDLLFSTRLDCDGQLAASANFVYPVVGQVGLHEVVDTFIDLNEDTPLNPGGSNKTVFADTLKFTTTWTGAATPHLQIDAVGNRFGLGSPANVGLSATRSDIHTLTLGLAMGPPLAPSPAVPLPNKSRRPRGDSTQQSINRDAATQAIEDLRFRSFLDRSGTLLLR